MTAAASSPAAVRQRDLAVAWMNRGHTLMLRDELAVALDAYDAAISGLRPLVSSDGPGEASWINSLGAALMNRGHLLHRLHGVARAASALAAFDEAAALLSPLADGASPWPRRNLAGILVNRANLLLDLAQQESAARAAREALSLTAPGELTDLVEADLSLKARRASCDALGWLIVAPSADQQTLATAASDLVDEALAVTRHWAARGEAAFAPLALRFFRYGCQLYRGHQPHFLAEFVAENLGQRDPKLVAIARETIDAALTDKPCDGNYLVMGDPATERRAQAWRELTRLQRQLAAESADA